MNPDVRKGALLSMVAIGKGLIQRGTVYGTMDEFERSLDRAPWVSNKAKADIRATADSIIRRGLFIKRKEDVPEYCRRATYEMVKAWNRAKRDEWAKTKKLHVQSGMEVERHMTVPTIFYLVSSHQKPQKAHAVLQGTVLADRYWRKALEDAGMEGWYIKSVESYMRNHKTKTVQWAMGDPCYLITRPNCRHRLIPIPTWEVLTSSERSIRKRHNPSPTGVRRPISDADRYAQEKALEHEVSRRVSAYVKP